MTFLSVMYRPGSPMVYAYAASLLRSSTSTTDFYDPSDELRVIWNDPSIGVQWPTAEPLLSDKNRDARTLDELMEFPPYNNGR